jgi:hypothetical protein
MVEEGFGPPQDVASYPLPPQASASYFENLEDPRTSVKARSGDFAPNLPRKQGNDITIGDIFTTREPSWQDNLLTANPMLMAGLSVLGANAANNPYDSLARTANAMGGAVERYEAIQSDRDARDLRRQSTIADTIQKAAQQGLDRDRLDIAEAENELAIQQKQEAALALDSYRRQQLALKAQELMAKGTMDYPDWQKSLLDVNEALADTSLGTGARNELLTVKQNLQKMLQLGLVRGSLPPTGQVDEFDTGLTNYE